MKGDYNWTVETALIAVIGALGLEQIPVVGDAFPVGGSHFVQAGFAVLLAVMIMYVRAHFGFCRIDPNEQSLTALVPVMPVAFRVAFVIDLTLLAIEEFVPASHAVLPLCGNHLWQLSGLMLLAYIWTEVRIICRKR